MTHYALQKKLVLPSTASRHVGGSSARDHDIYIFDICNYSNSAVAFSSSDHHVTICGASPQTGLFNSTTSDDMTILSRFKAHTRTISHIEVELNHLKPQRGGGEAKKNSLVGRPTGIVMARNNPDTNSLGGLDTKQSR